MEIFKLLCKNHIKSIILFFVLMSSVLITTSLLVYDYQLKYMENTITFNISEYGEVDREHLCTLLGCSTVIDISHNKRFMSNNNKLKKIEWQQYSTFHLWRNIYLVDNRLSIFNKEADSFFEIGNDDLQRNLILLLIIIIPILMASFLYPLMISVRNEKEESIRMHVGNEALLANKSMIMITENIHHELNTPLEIIDNKIEKIHRVIEEYLLNEYEYYEEHKDDEDYTNRYVDEINEKRDINTKLIKLTPDFEFIKTASEQIYNILDKMKGFKHMRYSNGNKTITDIVDSAFKIISISTGEFDHNLDPKLSNYSIKSDKFKNADLLGIIINNIKNSLEASATKVFIIVKKYEQGFLSIRIIDNGNGISPTTLKKVFEPNFSTKSGDKSIRGNGMYLNKQILKASGGDTHIVESSQMGTTLELKIPVRKLDKD